ncbi:MAG TPA: hypothetical protein VKV32_10750 [Stellaceae bacterium]|nr:hypothetical protein [Stellaceae bacterium]
MRVFAILAVSATALLLCAARPALAQQGGSQITCAQIGDAQHFVDGLKPGPNTSAAQKHLDAAKAASQAGNDKQCVQELGRVDYYARRSAAADKRAAAGAAHPRPRRHVLCADAIHQNRPGGSDWHGPSYGCPKVM